MSAHPDPADSGANRVAPASWQSWVCPAWRHSQACDPPGKAKHPIRYRYICGSLEAEAGLPSPVAFAASFGWSSSCPCSACSGTRRV